MNPKVSIVIPTYNRAHLIDRAINSVIAQTLQDWQLIIVDDGSKDKTQEVMAKYEQDSRIVYHRKHNSGAANSRNVGVALSKAELITFLDSDDEAVPEWLEKITAPFENPDIQVVSCGLRTFDHEGNLTRTSLPGKLGPAYHDLSGKFTNGGVFILRKWLFDAVSGYDDQLKACQHTELALRLTNKINAENLKVAVVAEPLIHIHVHKGERIRFDKTSVFEGTRQMVDRHMEQIGKDGTKLTNHLRVLVFLGLKVGRKKETTKYLKLLVKKAPQNLKTWYYVGKYLVS